MPIAIFDSATIPQDRRAELQAAVVAAGKHLRKRFEGWIVAAPDRREFCRADHIIPGGGYLRSIRLERECGRGDRASTSRDGGLTFVGSIGTPVANDATGDAHGRAGL